MRILAIDQGTSATKAVVVEADGSTGAVVEIPIEITMSRNGGVELEPEQLWLSVVTAGAQAIREAGGEIDAIGLANQGETILGWDRTTGRPVSRGIVWQDRRSTEICRHIAADGFAERLIEITGLELDPYFVAPKVAWLRDQIDSEATITTTDTWLLHRLTGAFATDAATASRSLLLDLATVEWSAEACEIFGIDPAQLPSIVSNATTALGSTTAFGHEIPITGVCVDQQAALFAESCHAPGESKCTFGTGAFLLASTGQQPTWSTNGLVGSVAWKLEEATTWCLDGQVYTVGAAVSWLQHVGLINEPADLDAVGGAVSSSGGAVFVPGLAGLAAPFWEPNAKGAFTGLSLATGRAEMVYAVIEGIAASVACLARAAAADLGQPLRRLRVDGGVSRSMTLLQVQADLAQVPIEVYPSPHATAIGVAAFAGVGLGTALADALPPWKPSRVVEPQCSSDEAETRIERWLAAAEATRGL